MTNVRLTGKRSIWVALAMVVVAAVLGARFAIATHAAEPGEDTGGIHVELSALAGAPDAKGSADIRFEQGARQGSIHVRDLPVQPYGSGKFYGAWFVRTDTGDKAFLGALIHDQSIIFSSAEPAPLSSPRLTSQLNRTKGRQSIKAHAAAT